MSLALALATRPLRRRSPLAARKRYFQNVGDMVRKIVPRLEHVSVERLTRSADTPNPDIEKAMFCSCRSKKLRR